MNRALLRKCVYEAQWLFCACALAVFSFAWVRVWLVGQLEMAKFKAIIDVFKDRLDKFLPVEIETLFSYTGRVAIVYDEAIIVLCIVIWAIARGTDCISGELGRGTMEMLLAQPLSRLQVLGHQALVTVTGTLLLAGLTWFGTYVGLHTMYAREEKPQPTVVQSLLQFKLPSFTSPDPKAPKEYTYTRMIDVVDPRDLLPGAVNLFALGFFLAGLSTLVSASDRWRWRAIGIVVGIYVIQLIMKGIGVAAENWKWLCWGTFFTAYEPQLLVNVAVKHPVDAWSFVRTTTDPNAKHVLAALGPLGFCSILWALGAAAYAGAAARFCTRDLPPPL